MANNTKVLCVKRFGWKRIAKNTQRFGWVLSDAEEETTVTETTTYEGRVSGDTLYINPKTSRSSKVRVWLSFYRDMYIPVGVHLLEFFYNIIFFFRRVLAFFLPIASVLLIIVAAMGGANDIDGGETLNLILKCWSLIFVFWFAFIILEGILARIASAILRK